ncbi:MAG TPA: efflux RND transporter periplasmic adaptor subunit [Thermoanaerobaculia bacterium]|nr:efflux RND transporter periplasmic adaptor subunit [Thermoanaerobaculia bacterium]
MTPEKSALDGLRIDRDAVAAGGSRARTWIVLAVLVVVVAAGLWWWLSRPRAVPVRTVAAREASAVGGASGAVLNASGYAVARRQATVSSKVTGKVTQILVEEGMAVQEGQILARLDDSTVRRQLALAEAQVGAARGALAETAVRLKEAELSQRRMRQLLKDGVSTQAQVDAAEAEVGSLRARLDLGREEIAVAERQVGVRRQDLEDSVIRAPFSGVAVSKDAQPGEMISPVSAGGGFTRTGICTLVDMSSLEIEVDVNESYINRVRAGQEARAVLDAYPDWTIPARVITVVPAADREKATVRVRLAFEQLDPRILPDMGVKVAFLGQDQETSQAGGAPAASRPEVLVPRAALRKDGGQDIVLVVAQGERVERRAVETRPATGDDVTVTSGLAGGEQVVVEGPAELKDGDRVKVQTASKES